MFKRLDQQKRIGTVSVIIGFALLFFTLLLIPLKTAGSFKYYLLIPAAVLILAPIPFMWRDGLRQMKQNPSPLGHWRRMRQSGFFDLLVLLTAIALLLCACWAFGLLSYRATLQKHAALAGGAAATLDEARALPDFIEYNFHQDLNLIAKNYQAFGMIALIIAGFVAVCGLYMRFISPIVKADEHLQIAHGVYRIAAQYAAAILIVLISLFPIYWMVISSLKTSDELMRAVPTLWPDQFIWTNYPNVLNKAPFARYLVNTLVTTVLMMLGELTIGVMAAYGFSKGTFKGKDILFMLVLGALMVPIQVTFVPIYVIIARLNAIDTWTGVVLPNLVSAYFIFMLRQNFMAVDNSYIEAGRIDGLGRFGTIIHVLCPMCKPTLITISIISFINGWNSYFWPKMVTQSEASRTIAVGVQRLKETYAGQFVSNYNEIMAGAVMAIIPIVFLFLILQKYIMTGMSKAAMK
ncbi:MAG: carbohydrate ABC transporter permease [Clostridia bacterium]|nr:carbohydrate ABC transporter permease [Clostridia bacterium]